MRSASLFLGTVFMVLAAAAGSAQPAVLAPGLWEITIRTESPEATPAMTTVVCISKEEAEDPKPPKSKTADDCKVTGGGRTGSVLSYTVKCGKRKSQSTSRFTFNGDQFEGVVEGKADDRDLRQVYSGRRIGECEETPQPVQHP